MNIPFWKMHGASNDFILVDDREGNFPAADRDCLAGIAARRTGIGCEGIILEIARKIVLLPAPLAPIIVKISPASTLKLIP